MIDFSTSEVYGISADHVSEEHSHGIGPVSQKRWVYATSKSCGSAVFMCRKRVKML